MTDRAPDAPTRTPSFPRISTGNAAGRRDPRRRVPAQLDQHRHGPAGHGQDDLRRAADLPQRERRPAAPLPHDALRAADEGGALPAALRVLRRRQARIGRSVYEDLGAELASDGVGGARAAAQRESSRRCSPKIIVIDSFKARARPRRLRRREMRRAGLRARRRCSPRTTPPRSCSASTRDDDILRYPEFAVADAIVELARQPLGTRDERYFRVLKLRGSQYLEGPHAFRITSDGIRHLSAARQLRACRSRTSRALDRISTGCRARRDARRRRLARARTTLLVGPTGSGKTTIALQFALEGVRSRRADALRQLPGEPGAARAHRSRISARRPRRRAARGLDFVYASPVELQIDSIIVEHLRAHQQRRHPPRGDRRPRRSGDRRERPAAAARLPVFARAALRGERTSRACSISRPGNVHARRCGRASSDSATCRTTCSYSALGGEERTRRTIRVIKTRNSGHDPAVARARDQQRRGAVLVMRGVADGARATNARTLSARRALRAG